MTETDLLVNGESSGSASRSLPSTSAKDGSTNTRHRFRPVRHLQEPPMPPPLDHKVEEELAAQAAAQAAGYEGRKMRRFLQRRTVDYMGSWVRYKDARARQSTARADYWLKPSPHFVIDLLPPAASSSPAACAALHLVHTSSNKIRTPVNTVSWVPTSARRLLTGSSSGEFTLWNGTTFNFETILQACDTGVRSLSWSPTGNLLLAGDAGGVVKYFLPNMNNVLAIKAHGESIRGVSFSPDERRWASGSDDQSIKVWDTERGMTETVMTGHGWDVKCLQWHPFKGLIASGGKDNLVKFWDPRKGGREIGTFHGHKNSIQDLAFSPSHVASSELLATASRDQTVKLYDLRMIKEFMTLKSAPLEGSTKEEAAGACSLAWHPTSPLLSSGLSNGVLQHHHIDTAPSSSNTIGSSSSSQELLPICTVPAAHDQSIWAMQWHPLGQVLATGANDCLTRWWERERLENGDFKMVDTTDDAMGAATATTNRDRNARSAWQGDDDDDGDGGFNTSSFIPGLGGAASSRPPLPLRQDRDLSLREQRAPLPPGFGFDGPEDQSRGGARGGQMNGSGGGYGSRPPGPPPPRMTGANVGPDGNVVRDGGWGRAPTNNGQQANDFNQGMSMMQQGSAMPGLGQPWPQQHQNQMPGFGMQQFRPGPPPGMPPPMPPNTFDPSMYGQSLPGEYNGQQQQQGGGGGWGR